MNKSTIITPVNGNSTDASALNWKPVAGEETKGLLDRKQGVSALAKESICDSAISILGQGINPKKPESGVRSVGLVIGHVQSGKTMSFVTATALARDNGFPMIIAITGTTNVLLGQSESRIFQDLLAEDSDRWQHYSNPKPDEDTIQDFKYYISQWQANGNKPASVLVTVMKHQQHLNNLAKLLKRMNAGIFPILIIDDEADQASLNTRIKNNSESAVFRSIKALREAALNHTFLQYTATPQALLLISTLDPLSPDYINLLAPGAGYFGGREFFIDGEKKFIRGISEKEIESAGSGNHTPPKSLHKALQIYLLGVAAGLLDKEKNVPATTKNRSMLVHPSVRQADHTQFHQIIKLTFKYWKDTLSSISLSASGLSWILRGFSGQHICSRPRTPRMNSLGLFCGMPKCRGEYLLCST